ncbi:alternative NAD(P)H-ubiquinone oxidoreductase C1, chloroplastic/mitochondrial isoform X2 [Nymphaea colorata]|uniref:alternative NAD(P)H-ubiquinone oxidoreductase C1, chloroplastic/mitochondrial isoform X2 n=1 Tax=Nymphaea colorata TaxID=210225 RepID=UPI00129D5689|nr:alternative NAD(P)H-ubiquinone oxidoreductase C1, chloroplastic/mitochondrial isoform X2 [Nymphaea colorata]
MESLALAASLSLFPLKRGGNYLAKIFMKPGNGLRPGFMVNSGPSRGSFCILSSTTKEGFGGFGGRRQSPRICILGGGFGGLYTALRLESLEWPPEKKPQVLLVDQSERFVFKPMLYELLTGEVDEWEIAPRFSELLSGTSIQFFQDRVKEVFPCDSYRNSGPTQLLSGGKVHLESGIEVEYDWLVLALGAQTKLDLVPGASEFALPFSTLEDAQRVEQKLRMLERGRFCKDPSLIQVAVVGCGYSGVELAATISERLQERGRVKAINVGTTICPSAPSGNREAALKVLSSRNVELFLGYYVSCIKKIDKIENSHDSEVGDVNNQREAFKKFILELLPAERSLQSQSLEVDLVLWTVGSRPLLPLVGPNNSGLFPANSGGQAEIDDTLRVKGHPRIFAIGDSAGFRDSSGRRVPATAQVAIQQADFAGWNLWAAINERPLLPFRLQNLGEMMTLGKYDAAISPSFVDGLTLEGNLGHTARKVAYLMRLPTDQHRLKVGFSWITKSAIDSIASLQSTLANVLS